MFSFNSFLLAIASIAIIQTSAVPIVEDSNGNGYYLVPIEGGVYASVNHRHIRSANPQRETLYDLGPKHAGIGQKYTWENNNHQLSGSAYASRDFAPKGPLTTGQGLEYLHKPTGSNLQLNAENTRGHGTDFKASGTYNFLQTQDKRGKLGVSGDYERHYGRGATSKPNYNVWLKGSYDF